MSLTTPLATLDVDGVHFAFPGRKETNIAKVTTASKIFTNI